jgi:hypothetical protein
MPEYVVEFILALTLPIATAAGSLAAAYLVHWVRENVSHTQTQELLVRAVHAAEVSVGEVAQTFVDDVKRAAEDGKLTDDEAEAALDGALDRARELLGPKGLRRARQVLGDDEDAIDSWLLALIESKVRELRQ